MTYVVAVKHHGQVAIIADFGISYPDRTNEPPSPSALKTGTLFEGCQYGVSGDADAARAFLVDFKKGLPPTWTIRKCWKAFVEEATRKRREAFELLLSYRHYLGEPHIYKYNARQATVDAMGDLASTGAGAAILDQTLQQMRQTLLPAWMLDLSQFNALNKWPHLYCLWLNQYAMSQDYELVSSMSSAGVVGLFHYIEQTHDAGYLQGRSVFCRIDVDDQLRTTSMNISHMTRRQEFVVMRNIATGDVYYCSDTHADPELKIDKTRLTGIELSRFMDDGGEFYGFGFSDPRLFSKTFFAVPTSRTGLPILWSIDWVDDRILKRIEAATGRRFLP